MAIIYLINHSTSKLFIEVLSNELNHSLVRPSISDRLIFDVTQYLFTPAKNSAPEF